jgi:hypothetical protein
VRVSREYAGFGAGEPVSAIGTAGEAVGATDGGFVNTGDKTFVLDCDKAGSVALSGKELIVDKRESVIPPKIFLI